MLLATGMVEKGSNVDSSALSSALRRAGKVAEFAENVPIVGEFAQLISSICGLFYEVETDTIVQKVYEIISFNYDTEE